MWRSLRAGETQDDSSRSSCTLPWALDPTKYGNGKRRAEHTGPELKTLKLVALGDVLVTAAFSSRLKTVTSRDGSVAYPRGHSLVAGCCRYNWLRSELGRTDKIQNIVRSNKLHFLPWSHPYPPLDCQLVRWSAKPSFWLAPQRNAPLGIPTPLSLPHLFLQNENTNSWMRNTARNCSSKFYRV